MLKITRQQYQLYESGKRELPMHHFITLARYYNVSLDFLAGLIDMPRKLGQFLFFSKSGNIYLKMCGFPKKTPKGIDLFF